MGSGHVTDLPQDVGSFANTLPRLPSKLDVIVVRKEGANESNNDFRVRRSVVLHALQWLLANNINYHNVRIDPDALDLLPEDGDLTGLCSMTLESSDDDQELSPTQDVDLYDAHLARTFVPSTAKRLTEQGTIQQSINERQSHQPHPTAPWPPSSGTPINEFNTEGYIFCAFPTLFPTGAADFVAPRPNPVTIGNYFRHLLMYDEGRFARHPRFHYFALNTEMRWRALQAGQIYIREHPLDARLSVEELRDMIGREGESFSNRVLHYTAKVSF